MFLAGKCRANFYVPNDVDWNCARADEQAKRYYKFLNKVSKFEDKLVVLELGVKPIDKKMPEFFSRLNLKFENAKLIRS